MKTKIGILSADYQGELLAKILLKKGVEVTILSEGNAVKHFSDFNNLNSLGFCSLFSLSNDNIKFARKVLDLNIKKTIQEKYLLIDTTVYKYPLQAKELLKQTNLKFILSSIKGLIYGYFKIIKVSNYEQYVKKYYGNTLFNFYFQKYLKNEFPEILISDLDVELVYRRVQYRTMYNMIKKIVFKNNENIYNTKYYYSAHIDELLFNKQFKDEHLRIENININKIAYDGVYHVYYSTNSTKHEISFDKIYSLLPITKLYNLLYPQEKYKELHWAHEYVYSFQIKNCCKDFPDGLFYVANSNVPFFQLSKMKISSNEHLCNVICNTNSFTNKLDLKNRIWDYFNSINLADSMSVLISCTYYLFEYNKPILICGFDIIYKKIFSKIEMETKIDLFGTKAKFEEFSFDKIVNELMLIDKTI